jgi:Ca2+-binding EF-hand superfamily protein
VKDKKNTLKKPFRSSPLRSGKGKNAISGNYPVKRTGGGFVRLDHVTTA